MADKEITFQYQVGAQGEVATLEKRMKPLLDNYEVSGSGNILVYNDPSVKKRLIITPNNVVVGAGQITSIELRRKGIGGFLHEASPLVVDFLIKIGDEIHRYWIEYSNSDRGADRAYGSICGDIHGDGTIQSNLDEALIKLVKATPEEAVLNLKSGFQYKVRFKHQ